MNVIPRQFKRVLTHETGLPWANFLYSHYFRTTRWSLIKIDSPQHKINYERAAFSFATYIGEARVVVNELL